MSDAPPVSGTPVPGTPASDTGALRARAARCRNFARIYASDIGASLGELADELDKQADRIDGSRLSVSLPDMPDDNAIKAQ